MPTGEMAVYDDSTAELYLYEDWDGPTYRRVSMPEALNVPAVMTTLVRDGREELLAISASSGDMLRIDLSDGSQIGAVTLGGAAHLQHRAGCRHGDGVHYPVAHDRDRRRPHV